MNKKDFFMSLENPQKKLYSMQIGNVLFHYELQNINYVSLISIVGWKLCGNELEILTNQHKIK